MKISEKLRMNAKQKNVFSTAMIGMVFNDHMSISMVRVYYTKHFKKIIRKTFQFYSCKKSRI